MFVLVMATQQNENRRKRMKKQPIVHLTLMAAALALSSLTGTALGVPEAEPNQPIQSAHPLVGGTGSNIVVNGTIAHHGPSMPDVDFYSFEAQEGDVITLNIEGTTNGLDASLTLFGPESTYPVLIFSSDATLDSGSTTEADPRIDPIRLNAPGRYTIAVSSFPVFFRAGGTMTSTRTLSSGEYTLVISGLTSTVQYVNIDIKPGSVELAPINPKAKGVIPVALLSSNGFNALDVDASTLTFGSTGHERSYQRCAKSGEDVNGDGRPDLVCHFDNELAGFRRGDSAGVVKGKTKGGKLFEGRGDLKVVPEKRSD
jgi:Bacterial pre-peptidase C-terminal domain